MKIVTGTFNQAKMNAVKDVFSEAEVIGADVDSKVDSQPKSDEETLAGAINRAKASRLYIEDGYGVGLEGGVMPISDQLYLCNWGALVTPDHQLFVASGARIPLPDVIAEAVMNGGELGHVMKEWTKMQNIRHHQGAIGIFTNEWVSRKEMFSHVVKLLAGQLAYSTKSE
ncbi:DUF84 family protein [Gracilibacillus caseinilyticus]|uniref:inosine/xanthosine triphosphatase n=1 Tax=Gracilibacillus caseinilyticus TaxID=2932256 RepID=A0ABY4ES95_9BACI|nr:DUF84 family protein [Gracilibacillus caseinilyticus]UOQ47104.1 DUF84 family protein [Gracilibacillus caseinilyticus]